MLTLAREAACGDQPRAARRRSATATCSRSSRQRGFRRLKVPQPGGILVALTEVVIDEMKARAAERGVTAPFILEPDHAGMLAIAELVTAGRLEVVHFHCLRPARNRRTT